MLLHYVLSGCLADPENPKNPENRLLNYPRTLKMQEMQKKEHLLEELNGFEKKLEEEYKALKV